MLERQRRDYPNRPNNLEDLGHIYMEIWNGLDQNDIRTLISRMNDRYEEIIRNRSGNTHYYLNQKCYVLVIYAYYVANICYLIHIIFRIILKQDIFCEAALYYSVTLTFLNYNV